MWVGQVANSKYGNVFLINKKLKIFNQRVCGVIMYFKHVYYVFPTKNSCAHI